jgi:hypothetical protein
MFRAVMRKFRECEAGGGRLQPIILDGTNAPRYRRSGHVRKREEFAADVYLTAVRTLTDPTELNLFKYHYCFGADFKLCCQKLGMTRGNFFHACYRVEQKLGKVFQELKPYGLFPTDEYFHFVTRSVNIQPIPVPEARYPNGVPLRPTLAPRPPKAATVPAQQPCAPKPAPVVVMLDVFNDAAVARQIRTWFSSGRSLRSISADLNRLGAPVTRGTQWYASTVKRVLMDDPYEQAA